MCYYKNIVMKVAFYSPIRSGEYAKFISEGYINIETLEVHYLHPRQ